MSKPRVLLADDHGIALAGGRNHLEDRCDIVGRVADGRAILDVDIGHPRHGGGDVLLQLPRSRYRTTVDLGAWELLARNLGKQLGHTEEVFTLEWRPNNSSTNVTYDHAYYHRSGPY